MRVIFGTLCGNVCPFSHQVDNETKYEAVNTEFETSTPFQINDNFKTSAGILLCSVMGSVITYNLEGSLYPLIRIMNNLPHIT